MPVIGGEGGGDNAAVDGGEMGGTDVRVGFGSGGSKYAVGKNGGGKGGGRDWKTVVLSKCQFSFSSEFGIDLIL